MKSYIFTFIFIIFLVVSHITGFNPGIETGKNFITFFKSIISFIPAVFILIGIFEVWVEKEKIEKHLGYNSNPLGYLWVILLSATTIGGLYVAFPIAYTLKNKGARLSYIFTYIGAATIARVPMTIYEATYVGYKFTIIRLAVSVPLVIISSIIMEKLLKNITAI